MDTCLAGLTSFVGRQAQLGELARMLNTAPLLTLVGVGGIGKTRLALRVAEDTRERYAHGAWLVELAPIGDSSDVAVEVARALHVRERPDSSVLETLAAVLHTRQLLLVLDNCEHVLTTCAELAANLLQTCPDLTILATSREPLGVAGEAVYQVPPLATSAPEYAAEGLAAAESIELRQITVAGRRPMPHDAFVVIDLRWHAIPFLVPLALVALLPALAIWVAALLGSLGLAHPLDALPTPATALTPVERVMRLLMFWAITLGGPLIALIAGVAAAVDAELRIEHWEVSARVRLPVPPRVGYRLMALVLVAIGALLFIAMAGHLAADCIIGGDCRAF